MKSKAIAFIRLWFVFAVIAFTILTTMYLIFGTDSNMKRNIMIVIIVTGIVLIFQFRSRTKKFAELGIANPKAKDYYVSQTKIINSQLNLDQILDNIQSSAFSLKIDSVERKADVLIIKTLKRKNTNGEVIRIFKRLQDEDTIIVNSKPRKYFLLMDDCENLQNVLQIKQIIEAVEVT